MSLARRSKASIRRVGRGGTDRSNLLSPDVVRGRVGLLVVDLLREVEVDANPTDEFLLRLEPIGVVLFALEDVLEQVTAPVVTAFDTEGDATVEATAHEEQDDGDAERDLRTGGKNVFALVMTATSANIRPTSAPAEVITLMLRDSIDVLRSSCSLTRSVM